MMGLHIARILRIVLAHSLWNVTPRVQNPPHIDVIAPLDVGHQKVLSRCLQAAAF